MAIALLCIDDDEEDLDLFDEAVRSLKLPYICVKAFNGKEGLQLLKLFIPDFIFLDINMPFMNGMEVLIQIRADSRFAHVPVVILSTSVENRSDLIRNGATMCITKPSSFPDLCLALKAIFQNMPERE